MIVQTAAASGDMVPIPYSLSRQLWEVLPNNGVGQEVLNSHLGRSPTETAAHQSEVPASDPN